MTIEERKQKLKVRLDNLYDKLLAEQEHQRQMINNQGWGYGMRHTSFSVSTRNEDSLKERISKIEEQIKSLS